MPIPAPPAVTPPAAPPFRPAHPHRAARARSGAGADASEYLVVRVGCEHFALELAAVEEAVELPAVHLLARPAGTLVGCFPLRGQLVALHSPVTLLGVAPEPALPAAIVLRAPVRVALAVDAVSDVIVVATSECRRVPFAAPGGPLLAALVLRDGSLIALLDAGAALAALTSRGAEDA